MFSSSLDVAWDDTSCLYQSLHPQCEILFGAAIWGFVWKQQNGCSLYFLMVPAVFLHMHTAAHICFLPFLVMLHTFTTILCLSVIFLALLHTLNSHYRVIYRLM